jgi:peptidyl-prolyl cis-trans isomerase C
MANQSTVKYQTQMMNQAILANALRENFFKNNQPTEEALKTDYNNIIKTLGSTEYRASHVLVQTEEEAKAIVGKLNQGGKFADIAKAQSKDPGSAPQGGDLDWANPQSFVPEFSQAMVALKKGEYTKTPVKSQFGYHIILLTDTKPTNPPAFEQVKEQLGKKWLNDRWEQYEASLLGKAKIQ